MRFQPRPDVCRIIKQRPIATLREMVPEAGKQRSVGMRDVMENFANDPFPSTLFIIVVGRRAVERRNALAQFIECRLRGTAEMLATYDGLANVRAISLRDCREAYRLPIL